MTQVSLFRKVVMSPKEIVQKHDPWALGAFIISLTVAIITVLSFLQTSSRDMDARLRALEYQVSSLNADIKWIKESQARTEKHLINKEGHSASN